MDNKNNQQHLNNPSDMTGAHRGAQGVDKAPGEEQREGPIENVKENTQQGKNKVDGDPTRKSDQPIENE